MEISIIHIDTACVLLEINGYKILTDPTLDGPGRCYHHGFGSVSRKTSIPAMSIQDLADIDLVLLSHHQHKDNLDISGRKFIENFPNVISTTAAASAIRGVIGLREWEVHQVNTEKLANLRVTATPAQHRPWWIPEFLSGKVIGFVIEFDGQENGAIYISGDTVFFEGVAEVASRFSIDIGIFHIGSVQFRYLTALGKYTMDSRDLIRAAHLFRPRRLIPVHSEGWSHFKELPSVAKRIILADSFTADRTLFLTSGEKTNL